MAIHELTLASLSELDGGRVEEALAQAMARILKDCDDRPGVTESRHITFDWELCPCIDEDGQLGSVRIRFKLKDKSPIRQTKWYDMHPRKKAGARDQLCLAFNDLADENVHQMSIDGALASDD